MALIRARRAPNPISSQDELGDGNLLTSSLRRSPILYDSSQGPRIHHDNEALFFQSIQILPTTDEILAIDKPVYLPKRDAREPHPFPPGIDRLLDIDFRHLRYEHVEKIRDIAYAAAQKAFLAQPYLNGYISATPNDNQSRTRPSSRPESSHETPLGNRYCLYENARVEELLSDDNLSIVPRISFPCPAHMRGRAAYCSGQLERGMLVALLCLDTTRSELEIYYLQVQMLQSTDSMAKRDPRRAAVQASFLPNTPRDTIKFFARLAQKLEPHVKICLVEFPKVLYAGFYNCLHRLQKLRGFAFSNLVAPPMTALMVSENLRRQFLTGKSGLQNCPPPRYAQTHEFEYHLQPILQPDAPASQASFTLEEMASDSAISMIQSFTSLDQGQAAALCHSLVSEIAFTQGPPGTGKTFLGIALTRVVLASRPTSSRKPVLVVCLTNHALDSFLSGLKEAGVENILRVGSGSREPWTDGINLREKRRTARFSSSESTELANIKTDTDYAIQEIDGWCKAQSTREVFGKVTWYSVSTYLFHYHRTIWDQFKSAAPSVVLPLLFDFWACGGDLINVIELRDSIIKTLKERSVDKEAGQNNESVGRILSEMTIQTESQDLALGDSSIWKLSADGRRAMVEEWIANVDADCLVDDLARNYADHQTHTKKRESIRNDRDVRLMQQADVIGMTTTACAGKWDVLNALNLEIVICEEAGEVLEPHVICALLPTIQHGIFIGDPKQLRPTVSEYTLNLESGPDYRLNESLFEKMILPRDPALHRLPMAQLNIQRRMHPAIADISRITYPNLVDAPSTQDHPATIGLRERVFWWDHRVPELEDIGVTRSHVNQYEVNRVVGLVRYLLNFNTYSPGDIAVITPYAGQLAELQHDLQSACKIWLDPRDREVLLSEAQLQALDDYEDARAGKDEVSMSQMLRIATIDNFQGEEAKVVILSTVRSGVVPGFLSVANRINVACSRARNGFYIIGNANTLSQVPMWNDIINLFGDRRGYELVIQCPNHPQRAYEISDAERFDRLEGCPFPCPQSLECGHRCAERCHPLELHATNVIQCEEECQKFFPCGHKCRKRCGIDCGTCDHVEWDQPLECGHVTAFTCGGKVSRCTFSFGFQILPCLHQKERICGDPKPLVCNAICHKDLDCGHQCTGICKDCHDHHHAKCALPCGKTLPKCQHTCRDECGHEGDCSPCQETVRTACDHGVRTRICSQLPELCLKPQEADPSAICCLPSTETPEQQRCNKVLPCLHQCASLTSEACLPPSACPCCTLGNCNDSFIYVPECSHTIPMQLLDEHNFQGVYKIVDSKVTGFGELPAEIHPPTCLICNASCPSIGRYFPIRKFAELPQVLDTFVAKAYSQIGHFAVAIEDMEQTLTLSFEVFKNDIRPGPLAAKVNKDSILHRNELSSTLLSPREAYRVNFIDVFERELTKVNAAASFFPAYCSIVGLHLQIQHLRAFIIALADRIRVGEHMLSVSDPTSSLRFIAQELLRATAAEAIASYREQGRLIATSESLKTSPALHVEVLVQEVMLYIVANHALHASNTTSRAHTAPAVAMPGLRASLDVATEVSKNHSAANAGVLNTIAGLRNALRKISVGDQATLSRIDVSGSAKLEKQYRACSRGGTASVCGVGHLLNKQVFGGGCPVCGKKTEDAEAAFREAGKHLREEAFLARLRGL